MALAWSHEPQALSPGRWVFPPPEEWPAQDLVCGGADLEPATLIDAYRMGLFPMPVDALPGVMGWWSPDPRGILPLDGLRVTRSLRQSARKFDVRVDTCFTDVVRACGDPAREGTWITPAIVHAYTRLHELGWAHSVEVFDDQGELAGGLYGVRVGGFFAGESMFHRKRDASKVALLALVTLMRQDGMRLLDTQWSTDHLATLGVIDVPRSAYLRLLADAIGTAGA